MTPSFAAVIRSARRLLPFSLILLVACSRSTPTGPERHRERTLPRPSSIVLITLDTTRADHLEPYGADNAETPNLSDLAASGIVFNSVAAVAPVTAPAHATLLTGLYPPRHGVRNNLTHYLADEVPTMAEWLSDDGFRTAAFVSAIVLERRYGLDQGFATYDDEIRAATASSTTRMTTERSAAATADRALAWLDSVDPGEPYFLWVHFYDPHLPYEPPPPWDARFADRPYDGEIAYMDSQIGRLLAHPRVADPEVLVVAVGDHGEGLGEHGEQAHGLLIYESTIEVPWIMRVPGGPAGARVTAPVSQVDLVPTLIDLLSMDRRPGFEALEGTSVLPLVRGGLPENPRPLFSESEVPFFSYGWSKLRAVRDGDLKYIDAPKEELYDLLRDPAELHNLAGDRLDDVRRLAAVLADWTPAETGVGETVDVDSETAERLRAIGYLAGDPQRPAGEGRGNPVDLMPVHEELQKVGELLASGHVQEAVRGARAALEMDPDNLAALRDLSRGLVQMGQLDEAAAVAKRATSAAPWSAHALMVAADVEYRRGDLQRALALIDHSLEIDPRFLEARLDRSRYLAELGRRDEAVRELQPLLESNPDNNWVALRYAEVAELGTGKLAAAESRLRTVLSRNPFISEAWVLLGTVLKEAGRTADAAAAYREAISVGAGTADLVARLALLLEESGNPGAEAALRDAIRSSPAVRSDLHVALGDVLAAQGRSQEARRQMEIAAQAPPFSLGTTNAKAMALLRLGRPAEAEALWMRLTREHPEYGKAWFNLSSLAIQRRDWSAVERYSRAALERDPDSAPARNNLAISLEELGRPGEAEEAYRQAIADDPSDWRALFNLGILLRKSGRYREAAAVQQQILDLAPSHSGAHFELGMLLAGPLGEPQRAIPHLQAVVEAEPDHPRGRQARAVLDQIRGRTPS